MNERQSMMVMISNRLLMFFIVISLLSLAIVPVFSQNNSSIVFVGEIEGNRDIYRMAVDGTNVQRLTDDAAEEGSPVWSPDRQHIAFTSNRSGDFEIFVMDANGRNQTNISRNNHYNGAPSWSPDGRYIVFISAGTHSNDVYIMDRDGSNPRAVTADGYEDVKAVFTPDGRAIVYSSIQANSALSLYQVDVNGQNMTTVLQGNNEDYDSPVLSPDGQRLAYIMTRYDNQGYVSEIYTSQLNAQNAALVTEIENSFITSVSWSPNDDELVYAVKDTRNKRTELYIVNINNGANRLVSHESAVSYDASWSSYEGTMQDITTVNQPEPITCEGSLPPRLVIGEQGRVVPVGRPNRWRRDPGISGDQFGTLDLGDQFRVLDGPVCQDGYTWWLVERNGKQGWTAEGADNEYWLEPLGS